VHERQGVRTKGRVGQYVEAYFGLETNNESGPDFPHLGVELKTVPMRRHKSGRSLSAKERTFITQINYDLIYRQPFEQSSLDTKTRRTLYVFYEWQRDQPTTETSVLRAYLHERDAAAVDMAIRAYDHVVAQVHAGRAHLLSEGDTLGIGPATKDAGGAWVSQPFGTELARRRAFAWKAAYTTALYRSLDGERWEADRGLEAVLDEAHERVSQHRGWSVRQLRDEYCPGTSDEWKSVTGAVSRRLLGSPSSSREPAQYEPFGLLVRAVRVAADGMPWEGTSFPAIDFRDVAEEEWESSPLIEQLRSILLVVFRDSRKQVMESELERLVHWQPTDWDIAVMREEYERFRTCIAESRPEEAPTEKQTQILHMRPHGTDGRDLVELPNGRWFRRSAFWLNRSYLQRVILRA
jgi:DNA mismatch repair protein MutH